MSTSRRPILVCYDGSPGAKQAVDAAGTLCPGQTAIVLHAWSGQAAERAVHYPVEVVRRELIDEVRSAARRDATAIAAEGTRRALQAGLEAKPVIFEAADGTADAIMHVAKNESVGAVVGRRKRSWFHTRLTSGVSRNVVDHCPTPVLVVHEGSTETDRGATRHEPAGATSNRREVASTQG